MSAAPTGKDRLQAVLMSLRKRAHPRGSRLAWPPGAGAVGGTRLQRALLDLSRRASSGSAAAPPVVPVPQAGARGGSAPLSSGTGAGRGRSARAAGADGDRTPSPAAAAGSGQPVDLVALSARLDRIEERLADLRNPLRCGTPAREIFREWIRNGHWEEVRFGDYLRMRRAGLL